MAIEAYLEQQAATIAELYRVLADDGSICWQVGNFVEDGEVFPLDILYYPIFKRLGLYLRNRRAMGAEREARYTDFIRERIAAYYAGTLRIRPMGKPVHKPTGKEKITQVPIEWQSNAYHGKGEEEG